MFYERWLEVVRTHGRELALRDLGSRRAWSFVELAAAADRSTAPAGSIVCPQGQSADFVLALLQAWRWNSLVCPLEPGQTPPSVPRPPVPCLHLKTTSATTGTPRVVAFTADQLAADAANIVATMGLRSEWPNLGVISMAHSYGFSNLVLPLLLHGIPLIILPAPLPEALRRAARDFPVLTLPAVPALWHTWVEAGAIPPNIRLAISAGAPLSVSLEQRVIADAGVKIHNFYGSTECGGIAYDRTPEPRTDETCIGTPLEEVKVSLNTDGCLRVHSRATGQTYWPKPDEALVDGSFQTSDLAEIKTGAVYLRGRLGDQINVAGRKVLPATVEQALRQHPAVTECLVFGVPGASADRADVMVACVVTRSALPVEELRQFLLQRLPAWQVPREWRFVPSLPTDPRGKLSRLAWRQRFLASRLEPPPQPQSH
jgi:long-chain acyl-CoA synthetase